MIHRLNPIIWRITLFVILFCNDRLTYAATLEMSAKHDCAFNLSGPIVNGDFEKLSSLLAVNKIDPLDERTGAICLQSNGGSYVEGLRLAELVFSRGMSTVIESGSECFSACALIFLGGAIPDRVAPMRKLSFGGVIGFHAPYLKLSGEKYSKEEATAATDRMRRAIVALMQFSARRPQITGDDFVKSSLLSKIISKGPEEAFFIKTVYDAARWDIQLYDIESYLPAPRPSDGIKNLCANFHSAKMDQERPIVTPLALDIEKYSSKYQNDDYRVLVRDLRTKDIVCEVYPRTAKGNQRVMFYACSFDYWSNKNFGDCREYRTAPAFRIGNFVPAFFSYNPDTLLLRLK